MRPRLGSATKLVCTQRLERNSFGAMATTYRRVRATSSPAGGDNTDYAPTRFTDARSFGVIPVRLHWPEPHRTIGVPIGECYGAEYPEKDYPEHTLWPRDPRNASPTRKKNAKHLVAFWDYRELNKSFEPLQSTWGHADNNDYDSLREEDDANDDRREEGDAKKPERDVEAELETRPNETELVACYDLPTVKYTSRQVGLITGPKLSDCGYCMAPTSPLNWGFN